ncbi:amidophosphoribosyltransferase [Alligator mississippiensis]|uniref:Amidophosphoribosyltransferase n=1 Tax=Alligator mississippiensis TaxID=8496 RepID=A0A151PAT8_ALLMI|nr:amidophosphoribosyltransferase [Alligator mississippiensis]
MDGMGLRVGRECVWEWDRGQESAGIVTSDGESAQAFKVHKGMGLINHVFSEDSLKKLYVSNLGIGHTRYSTSGISELQNCQPFVVETLHGKIAVAHNGELTNAVRLRRKLMRHGVGLSTSSDSELITQLLAFTPPLENDDTADWVARIKNLMNETPTSYSLLLMHKDIIYAVRDPYGNRPLCIGRLVPVGDMNGKGKDNRETEGWVVSSESCSFLSIGAEYYREVLPGEIVKISRYDVQTLDVVPRPEGDASAFCIFEYVYFARPDSIFEGQMVYSVRRRCGQQLAIEAPVEADLVSTVPESATPAALGFAQKCGLPYIEVLCKNRYVGRTFIQPNMRLRQLGVAKKFGVLSDNFKGKRVVLIDDSIVRGNTISPIIKLLRESGAKEVHIRVASPPIRFPCYMGINIPTKEELIANKPEFHDLANYIGADSVVYLSVEGLVSSVQESIKARQENENHLKTNKSRVGKIGHCIACLTGEYPVALEWPRFWRLPLGAQQCPYTNLPSEYIKDLFVYKIISTKKRCNYLI